MRTRWLWLVMLACTVQAQVAGYDQQAELSQENRDNQTVVSVVNPYFAPLSARIEVTGENLRVNPRNVINTVVPARAQTTVFSVSQDDPSLGWQWNVQWRYVLGSVNARADSAVYDLPFASGKAFRVGQGYGGAFSHQNGLQFALDFDMPEGTPVHAAREGVVVSVETSNTQGGVDPALVTKGNQISVLHADGTIGAYVHLRPGGSFVEVGQRVTRGQRIGLSGNTGFSSHPHLHFHVQRAALDDAGFQTLPVRFRSREGNGLTLQEGRTYTAR